ncbi:MAG: ABC transporter permease subunit, partial [Phaeodactylibacter sp.]|nr:ABC transporter permease subunit [Phaeodactylibacter sp.]
YDICAAQYGLNKPLFYFGILPASLPDTLHRILPVTRRSTLRRLAGRIGEWEPVQVFHRQLLAVERQLHALQRKDELRQQVIDLRRQYHDLRDEADLQVLEYQIHAFRQYLEADTLAEQYFGAQFSAVEAAFDQVQGTSSNWRNYVPIPRWYGFDNQYHDWIRKVLVGDFGISYEDKRPVFRKIGPALYWTLIISLTAFFWAFVIGIPLGVYSAVYKDSWLDRLISGLVFFFFSLPRFWVATLLVLYFTTDYYFSWPNFASIGLGDVPEDAPFWERFWGVAPHLVLPVFCMTYVLIAFITRQMRRSMIEALEQDFIRTARAKGVQEWRIIWRHAFRNALFPVITMIASLFPAAIGGSIVIEYIFRIPGMGSTVFNAINREDWPVVFTFLVLSAFLTMVGILVSDILYALADPRVRFKQKH